LPGIGNQQKLSFRKRLHPLEPQVLWDFTPVASYKSTYFMALKDFGTAVVVRALSANHRLVYSRPELVT
jgi:hypothetical protein